jgi:hypothetical protein
MPITPKQISMNDRIRTAIAKANERGLCVSKISQFGAYWVFTKSDLPLHHIDNKKNRVRITGAAKLLEFLEKKCQ